MCFFLNITSYLCSFHSVPKLVMVLNMRKKTCVIYVKTKKYIGGASKWFISRQLWPKSDYPSQPSYVAGKDARYNRLMYFNYYMFTLWIKCSFFDLQFLETHSLIPLYFFRIQSTSARAWISLIPLSWLTRVVVPTGYSCRSPSNCYVPHLCDICVCSKVSEAVENYVKNYLLSNTSMQHKIK